VFGSVAFQGHPGTSGTAAFCTHLIFFYPIGNIFFKAPVVLFIQKAKIRLSSLEDNTGRHTRDLDTGLGIKMVKKIEVLKKGSLAFKANNIKFIN